MFFQSDPFLYYNCMRKRNTRTYTCQAYDDPLRVPVFDGNDSSDQLVIPIRKWIPATLRTAVVQRQLRKCFQVDALETR